MSSCDCSVEIDTKEQRRVLIILLVINFTMFLVEIFLGIIAESTGLIADSLDMLADATVYSIGLYAVGRSANVKLKAAFTSGIFQILLSLLVAIDIIRRFIYGSDPESTWMIIVGVVALIANTICLMLISKHKNGEVHMRASWIFSKNDVIANIGVIIAGALVFFTGTRWPDLIIGAVIVWIVLWGGISIIRETKTESKKNLCDSNNR
ncbi:MAG: cation diffusion facilitator family transporter [Gammaproteobacteria bacterium]|nr:cation diffusion facilitator family transporter [Gammaproteobacteria bacterium]